MLALLLLLVGLVVAAAAGALLVLASPHARGEAPRWRRGERAEILLAAVGAVA